MRAELFFIINLIIIKKSSEICNKYFINVILKIFVHIILEKVHKTINA